MGFPQMGSFQVRADKDSIFQMGFG